MIPSFWDVFLRWPCAISHQKLHKNLGGLTGWTWSYKRKGDCLGRVSSPMSCLRKTRIFVCFFCGASFKQKRDFFIVRAWLQHVQRAREKHRLGLRSQLQLALRRWHRWGVSAHDFTLAVGETTGLRVCAKRWRNESLDPAQELRAVWKSDAE